MLSPTNNQVVCLRYGRGGDYRCLINSGVLLRREAHHRHDYSHLLILSFYRTLDSDSWSDGCVDRERETNPGIFKVSSILSHHTRKQLGNQCLQHSIIIGLSCTQFCIRNPMFFCTMNACLFGIVGWILKFLRKCRQMMDWSVFFLIQTYDEFIRQAACSLGRKRL